MWMDLSWSLLFSVPVLALCSLSFSWGFLWLHSDEQNILEAASSGASASIGLVANIAANLIAFLAILEFINAALRWLGGMVGYPSISFEVCFAKTSYMTLAYILSEMWHFYVILYDDYSFAVSLTWNYQYYMPCNVFVAIDDLLLRVHAGGFYDGDTIWWVFHCGRAYWHQTVPQWVSGLWEAVRTESQQGQWTWWNYWRWKAMDLCE